MRSEELAGRYLFGLLVASLGLASAFFLVAIPVYVQAQAGSGSIVRCSGTDCTLQDLLYVPVVIYNYMLGAAAAVFIVVVIWAGVRMMIYHASESPESELVNAKFTLFRGITGFVIIAGAYTIVNVLVIGILGLNPGTMFCNLLACFFDFAVNAGCSCSLPTILTGS
jgi:hypothetical protein